VSHSLRISVDEVRNRISAGEDVILICAYMDENKCNQIKIEDALGLQDLSSQLEDIPSTSTRVVY